MALKKDEIREMRKNDICVNESLKELAKICKAAYKNGIKHKDKEYLKNEMFNGMIPPKNQDRNPSHRECDSTNGEKDPENKTDPEKETEKRICRCMRYYDEHSTKCMNCPLKRKWKRDTSSNIKVIEYEWPMEYVIRGVGGIDLLLEYGNEIYAVETKRPEGNSDTISLMIAEILTYTCDNDDYLPAIAVFENGFHHRKIKRLIKEKNKDFLAITKFIPVFLIKYETKGKIANYNIVPMIIDY